MKAACLLVLIFLQTASAWSQSSKPKPTTTKAPADPCASIRLDETDGKRFRFTDLSKAVILTEAVADGDTTLLIRAQIDDENGVTAAKGMKILFENGDVLTYEDKEIEIEKDDDGYHYSATVVVPKYNLVTFCLHKLALVELYIFRKNISNADAALLVEQAKCLL